MTYTIRHALIPVEEGYTTVDVQIEGEKIAAVGTNLPEIGTLIDAQNQLLLPGFVNGHTHSPQIWLRGLVAPLPLELWLSEIYEEVPSKPEWVYWSAVVTAVETLLSGGTTLLDHLSLIPGQERSMIEAVVKAYQDVGIRAFVAPLIRDEPMEAGIPGGGAAQSDCTDELLQIMEDVVSRFHRPDQGIHIAVAPTGPQLCSDALYRGCIKLSDRHNLCRHSHLLETKAQQKLMQEKFGCTGAEHLHQLGYLGSRTSLAHCVWLTDSDISILAETQATVVHNPLSNLRLGSGIAPVLKYLEAGVNVSFGCDGAASNDAQDLLEVIKIGTILHSTTDFDYRRWITPRQSLKMAALGGAQGLNLTQSGTLEVGKLADLVLYDLTNLSLLPKTDPIGLLVLGRPANVVNSVWVAGKRVVADGKVMGVDPDELKPHLLREDWRVKRLSQATQALEKRYRTVMGLEE